MKTIKLKSISGTPLHLVKPTRFTIDYKQELNEAQYIAVTRVDGALLVIAGAGTGKTRTIVYRVAYLIECGVKPKDILLLTFTRKAAQEMLRRAALVLDSRCEHVGGGTFHSYANGVLRKYAQMIGFESNFTILDQTDAEDVMNLLRTQMKYDTREKRFPRKATLYDLHSRSINTVTPLLTLIDNDYPQYLDQENDIRLIHQSYMEYKRRHNLMDYDDLLVHLIRLMRDHPTVAATLADQCKYIMVDEYQDTNRLQAEIVRLLSQKHKNVMVVGDDAQTIYTFRGSTIENMYRFSEEYPGCEVVTLEENYRSTQPILDLANEILKRSSNVKEL
jgi:DNA helicase-2/ATP-dependent DNA helicase PcrA